jgi:hypothetical protein
MLFRETRQIFNSDYHGEVFESSWMTTNVIVYPDTQEWDYKRELRIDDVEIWEVIREWTGNVTEKGYSGPCGIYAAWRPHAELYMVKLPPEEGGVVTFYGPGAEKECRRYLDSKGIDYFTYSKHHNPGITVDRKGLHYHYKV